MMFSHRTSAHATPRSALEVGLSNWSTFEEVQELVSARAPHAGGCGRPCRCRTAEAGRDEHCLAGVVRAREGAAATPEAYPELKGASSLEDFQRYLWKHASSARCPMPCAVTPWGSSSNAAVG